MNPEFPKRKFCGSTRGCGGTPFKASECAWRRAEEYTENEHKKQVALLKAEIALLKGELDKAECIQKETNRRFQELLEAKWDLQEDVRDLKDQVATLQLDLSNKESEAEELKTKLEAAKGSCERAWRAYRLRGPN